MPNDCSNNLYVWGNEEALQKFVEDITVDGRMLILRSLYPCPTELYETVAGFMGTDKAEEHRIQQETNVAKYGHKDWYDWCCANWGTKWDACHAESELKSFGNTSRPGELFYSFDTAWSSPAPIIDILIAKFGHVEMFYDYEEEQGWGGTLSAFGGEILEQSEYDVPNSHKEMVERNGHCWCQHTVDSTIETNPVFDDCFGALASERNDITDEAKETAKSLSPGWHSTFDDLLETAKVL